jgi:hypothetical protein
MKSGLWVCGLLVMSSIGCDGADEGDEVALQPAALKQNQELRLFARGGPGIFVTTRHANREWDPIPGVALTISGNLFQGSNDATNGYFYEFDGRGFGVLIKEVSSGFPFPIIGLPPPPFQIIPPFIQGAEVADVNGNLNVCATSQTIPLHTTTGPDGKFLPWTEVATQAGPLTTGDFLSCTASGKVLHACIVDAAGVVQHSTRKPDKKWKPWDALTADVGTASHVRCRAHAHVIYAIVATDRGAFFGQRPDDGDWGTFEHLATTIGDPHADELRELAVVNGEVQVVGGSANGVWHTIRHKNGSWDPIGDVKGVVEGYPDSARQVVVATVPAN